MTLKPSPLNMIRARIAKCEAELMRLREKERVAQRWEFEDLTWDAVKPKW
jgi:hypothetical protein